MRILKLPLEMRCLSERWRNQGLEVGFVPTMGALHEGHLSLVRESLRRCERTVVSVFVNPIQFGPAEDFGRYPRPLKNDIRLLRRLGVDALYHPSGRAVFPGGFATLVDVTGPVTSGMCAPRRPGHFRGVATIVAKLFNTVKPHAAFFGEKDAQQVAVIRRMVKDLDFGVEVVALPIVREPDGLAMSSRNKYLSPLERAVAPAIHRALRAGERAIASGERKPGAVLRSMLRAFATRPPLRVEYVEFVDAETFERLKILKGNVLVALAVRLGRTRLIDNLMVRVPVRGGGGKEKE